MVKYLVFDLDGTLYDEKCYKLACYSNIARSISLIDSDDVLQSIINYISENGDCELFQFLCKNYHLDNSYINKFLNIYHNLRIDLNLFSDVSRFLSINTIPSYVLTNGSFNTQMNKINNLKIEHYFREIIVTGAYLPKAKWKPHEQSFDLLRKFNIFNFNECLFVGDSLTNDIFGALSVGMKACLIDRNNSFSKIVNQDYYKISSFDEINNILKAENNE